VSSATGGEADRARAIAVCRLLLATLILVTVAYALIDDLGDDFSAVSFFSYFTIESNLFAAGVLIAAGLATLRGGTADGLALWRGAAVLYMATTGLGYVLLLSGSDGGNGPDVWVNAVLHYVAPVAVVVDWLLDPPRRRIPFERTIAWMAFPAAFIVYTVLRGLAIDWYPYPFVDPDEHGYLGVAVASAFIGVAMLGFSWLITRRRAAVQT
jgi:hypothetical protein